MSASDDVSGTTGDRHEVPGSQADLVHEVVRLTRWIDEAQIALDKRKAELRALGSGTYSAGDAAIEVGRPGKRFDAKVAKIVLTSDQWRSVLILKPDAAQARRILTASQFASCQSATAAPVSVKSMS